MDSGCLLTECLSLIYSGCLWTLMPQFDGQWVSVDRVTQFDGQWVSVDPYVSV